MAPRGVAKARDYDYSNVGKQGRRTGITLKEGRRDEHGMEELDGVFSSPEKSPVRFTGNDTMMGSEGMSIDEDDGPGPTDFLSRSAARRSPFFPPPVARSPMKSGLSGSPRRTPGLRSSPIAQNDVPSSPTSARQRRGRLNEDAAETNSRQPLNDRRPNTAPIVNGSRQKGAVSAYANDENFPINEDDEDEDEINDVSVYQNEPIEEDFDVHEISDDGYGDDADEIPDDTTNIQNEDPSEEEPSPVQAASLRTKKRKAPATTEDVDSPVEDISQNLPKKKRAGRPPKAQTQKATQEKTTERPVKKAKTSKPQPAKEREPLDPELEQVVENHVKRTGPLKGRSLYILKREVPNEQQAAHTRSGRVSVRPLAYWRNERCVYGDGEADLGQRYPLSTIKEIIRAEDIEPEKKGGKKRKGGKKSKSKKQEEDSDDDDDERDKWEVEDGVLHGYIKKWDTDNQVASSEEEVTEIAYAPTGVETRDVKDSTFRVAKLLSQPFFGSGIVELPAKGVKKPKNSKRMHMVFYVCWGRVQVDINGVQFTAGKGCIFQVPRGNHYSFANITPKEARLFFTQAFMPNGSDNDNDNEPASSSKRAATNEPEPGPEVEDQEAESSKAPAKGKGRGRGRKAVK